MLTDLQVADTASYGCAVQYDTRTSAEESTFVTVLASCPVLEVPDNGRLECSGPDTEKTCEVRATSRDSQNYSIQFTLSV